MILTPTCLRWMAEDDLDLYVLYGVECLVLYREDDRVVVAGATVAGTEGSRHLHTRPNVTRH